MKVPIVAGAVNPAVLRLIAEAAAVYQRRSRLDLAVRNVNLEPYQPTAKPLLDGTVETGVSLSTIHASPFTRTAKTDRRR